MDKEEEEEELSEDQKNNDISSFLNIQETIDSKLLLSHITYSTPYLNT